MSITARKSGCTIVSPNYLPYARTLAKSYRAAHPDHDFYVLIVADLIEKELFRDEPFTAVMLHEIGVENIRSIAMTYDILELNTNVKPNFMLHLLRERDVEQLSYLDPDIFIYTPMSPVYDLLDSGATAVVTPHMTTPVNDGKIPGEQEMLYNGTYNLGFIALRYCDEAIRLLAWWAERCIQLGFSEGRSGLFVDQKWINLAPGLFDGVAILRHAGCNMAYWNLHERALVQDGAGYTVQTPATAVSGALCFYHFSGVVVDDPAVLSKHTNRFTLAMRPDLTQLFADYKAAVIGNRNAATDSISYGFDALSDGTAVTRLARRIYSKHASSWTGDPFDATGGFAKFAKEKKLIAGKASPKKATWNDFNPHDRRVDAVHTLLKGALRILGPNKYELLMRYLAHIAILRNQSVFLRDDTTSKH